MDNLSKSKIAKRIILILILCLSSITFAVGVEDSLMEFSSDTGMLTLNSGTWQSGATIFGTRYEDAVCQVQSTFNSETVYIMVYFASNGQTFLPIVNRSLIDFIPSDSFFNESIQVAYTKSDSISQSYFASNVDSSIFSTLSLDISGSFSDSDSDGILNYADSDYTPYTDSFPYIPDSGVNLNDKLDTFIYYLGQVLIYVVGGVFTFFIIKKSFNYVRRL